VTCGDNILTIFLIINWPDFVYLLVDPEFLSSPSLTGSSTQNVTDSINPTSPLHDSADLHQSRNNIWQKWGRYVHPSPPRCDTVPKCGRVRNEYGHGPKFCSSTPLYCVCVCVCVCVAGCYLSLPLAPERILKVRGAPVRRESGGTEIFFVGRVPPHFWL